MVELKTLKDLEDKTAIEGHYTPGVFLVNSGGVSLKTLKEEIIKWIKYLEECLKSGTYSMIFSDGNRIELSYQSLGSMKALLKHIHNITEEDL